MIDHDLSDQLRSLAATVNEPFDLNALHRTISLRNRRRSAVKVGAAGAGVAAIVGGLVMVRDRPADTGLVAAASVPTTDVPLPDCAAVLDDLRAATLSPAPDVSKVVTPNAVVGSPEGTGFKGFVTIQAIDGTQITFSNDEPKGGPATDGVASVDATTEWVDGDTPLAAPPELAVGEHVSLATTQSDDGVDHVIFADVGAAPVVDVEPSPDDKTKAAAVAAASAPLPDETVVIADAVLPPGPTAKALGSITAVGASSIDVSLDSDDGTVIPVTVDVAGTPFYAGDSVCVPGVLTVGSSVGVAYHTGDDGTTVADAVMVIPSD